jgi:uncharacterized protein
MMNYATIIQFVKEQTSNNNRPSTYPFRDRFEHTMRVYRWAIKLQNKLGGDIEIISLAALLHDIGWDENGEVPHGDIGAQMAAEFLVEMDYDPTKIGRICEIIRRHEEQDTTDELSLECQIVMDADLLDELGAIGILWDAMATATTQGDEASYKRAYSRIRQYYKINMPKRSRAKTPEGKREYQKRMDFVQSFISQLERELF